MTTKTKVKKYRIRSNRNPEETGLPLLGQETEHAPAARSGAGDDSRPSHMEVLNLTDEFSASRNVDDPGSETGRETGWETGPAQSDSPASAPDATGEEHPSDRPVAREAPETATGSEGTAPVPPQDIASVGHADPGRDIPGNDGPDEADDPMGALIRRGAPRNRLSETDARVPPFGSAQENAQVVGRSGKAADPVETGPVETGAGPRGSEDIDPEETEEIRQELEEIRREGLTGRQLRMARRVANKSNLAFTSDYDAVRQLRNLGIDPFNRAKTGGDPDDGTSGRDVTLPGGPDLPDDGPGRRKSDGRPLMRPSDRRQREIMDIQRDIARRRRRRMLQLLTRLSFFVFLPTLLAGYYYFHIATRMYQTQSEFLILQADATGSSGIGSLLSGTQFATNQDAIAVQSYLQSKEAMTRLDQDAGFRAHFSDPKIDPIQRLPKDPTIEDAYRAYKKYVKVGFDPTEGIIKMTVTATSPQKSVEFAKKLINYAEERIDEMSQRKREDAVSAAQESLEQAKQERREAQQRLVSLQEGTVVDPDAVVAGLRAQITNVEAQLNSKQLELAALQDNASPNQARVAGVKADIQRFQNLLSQLNQKMQDANATDGDNTLASTTSQIQLAQADLTTANMFLQSALQNEKQTEMEANRQVRYLTTSVQPVLPQAPSYPHGFQDTILVFLIMSGLYLMVSLTGAILREQVAG